MSEAEASFLPISSSLSNFSWACVAVGGPTESESYASSVSSLLSSLVTSHDSAQTFIFDDLVSHSL